MSPPASANAFPQFLLEPFSVLLVEDQASVRATLAGELRHVGVSEVLEAASADAALQLFKLRRPDLVLLDIHLPGGNDGYWVAQRMREAEPGGWTPIIFLSGLDGDLDVWRGIEAGGDDYLVKPVKPIVLAAKLRAMRRLRDMRRRLVELTEELHVANQHLNEMVEMDPLTGLVNRRGFDRILHSEILAARRDGVPLTLMLCDLDHFKRYNDTLGHVQGDACLKEVGRVLHDVCMRPRDVASRYGGEEFALILPNTPRSGAMTFARAGQAVEVPRHRPSGLAQRRNAHAVGWHYHVRARRRYQRRDHAHARRRGPVCRQGPGPGPLLQLRDADGHHRAAADLSRASACPPVHCP